MTEPASPSLPILLVENLCFGWPERQLFNQLSFQVAAGLGVVHGDEGSGKSTLLALIAGAVQPHAGRVTVCGAERRPLTDDSPADLFWIDPQTDAHHALTPGEFLNQQRPRYAGFDDQQVGRLVHGFALEPHMGKPLYMLSTGSRRKVWWTAAFASQAPLVLMDQPFAALDAPSSRFLCELFHEASQSSRRAWVLADHGVPPGVEANVEINLDETPAIT